MSESILRFCQDSRAWVEKYQPLLVHRSVAVLDEPCGWQCGDWQPLDPGVECKGHLVPSSTCFHKARAANVSQSEECQMEIATINIDDWNPTGHAVAASNYRF